MNMFKCLPPQNELMTHQTLDQIYDLAENCC